MHKHLSKLYEETISIYIILVKSH